MLWLQSCAPYLPLGLRNTRITAEDILAVLGYASANRISMDAACHELKGALSANRLREVLVQALPDHATLQRGLNQILHTQTAHFVKKGKRSYYISIDLTLIPYHGECYTQGGHQLRFFRSESAQLVTVGINENEIVRGEAKSGTTRFHGYATVSIVHDNQHYVLALRFVEKGESLWLKQRYCWQTCYTEAGGEDMFESTRTVAHARGCGSGGQSDLRRGQHLSVNRGKTLSQIRIFGAVCI